MKFQEVESVADFITNSFADGKVVRELRLTNEELTYVKEKYPYAEIERLTSNNFLRKSWYRIDIKPKLTEEKVYI